VALTTNVLCPSLLSPVLILNTLHQDFSRTLAGLSKEVLSPASDRVSQVHGWQTGVHQLHVLHDSHALPLPHCNDTDHVCVAPLKASLASACAAEPRASARLLACHATLRPPEHTVPRGRLAGAVPLLRLPVVVHGCCGAGRDAPAAARGGRARAGAAGADRLRAARGDRAAARRRHVGGSRPICAASCAGCLQRMRRCGASATR
jgi:hypothetical protein